MKFMFNWKIRPGHHKTASLAFMETAAPMPDGLTAVGRWHAPGSSEGWLLAEADDLAPVANHVAAWADLLEIRVIPVVEDEIAAQAAAAAYAQS